MSLICIVCQEPLTSNPEPGNETDWDGRRGDGVPKMLFTVCGHGYHELCLSKWFQTSGTHNCPYCKAVINTNDNRKIFAVGDEDFGENVADARSVAKIRELEMATLRDENRQVHNFLKESQQNLEAEQIEHDALKFEFACQESTFGAMKTEMENKNAQLQAQILKLNSEIALLKMDATKTKNEAGIKRVLKHVTDAQVLLGALLNDDHDIAGPLDSPTTGNADSADEEDLPPFELLVDVGHGGVNGNICGSADPPVPAWEKQVQKWFECEHD